MLTWPDGNKYDGEFADGLMNGHGIYTWANGDEYNGEFANDVINGDGIYTWPNGDEYKGSFKNDEMLHGTMVYADGTREII